MTGFLCMKQWQEQCQEQSNEQEVICQEDPVFKDDL